MVALILTCVLAVVWFPDLVFRKAVGGPAEGSETDIFKCD